MRKILELLFHTSNYYKNNYIKFYMIIFNFSQSILLNLLYITSPIFHLHHKPQPSRMLQENTIAFKEIQAVVLAGGYATRLHPLNAETPGCLLPLCNVPLLLYPLAALEAAGFTSVAVLTIEAFYEKLRSFLYDEYTGELEIELLQANADDSDTMEALLSLRSSLTTDLLVLPCDLVTDESLRTLVGLRRDGVTFSFLTHKPLSKQPINEKKWNEVLRTAVLPTPLLLVEPLADATDSVTRVLYMDTETTPVLPFRPTTDLHLFTGVLDSHVYLFSLALFDFATEKAAEYGFEEVQKELLPYIVNNQHMESLQLPSTHSFIGNTFDEKANYSSEHIKALNSFFHNSENKDQLGKELLFADSNKNHVSSLSVCRVAVGEQNFCLRVNSITNFLAASFELLKLSKKENSFFAKLVAQYCFTKRVKNNKEVRIDKDSLIGKSVSLGKGSVIKKSLVGKHCKIGTNVRLTSTVLLDHVQVEDNCFLQDCVVGQNCLIKKDCKFFFCVIDASYKTVSKETKRETVLYSVY